MNHWWPLQDFLELGTLVSAIPCARLHVRQVLWEWGIGNIGDSAELLVAELITNAVRASCEAGRDSAVRLWLLSDSAQFLERYSKPHVIEKKNSARAASNASW
jgi:hypothetical protein